MIKRVFDIIVAALAVLLLSPLLLPVVIILRATGEHEIFYQQERMGRGGKPFLILKFATMLKNSPHMAGGDITVRKDPRVLPFGHFLRKTKINELPQLLNIIKGDMSIIGPRPLTKRIADLFPPAYWRKLATVRPGLSGIGSIVFRDEETLLSNAQDRQHIYSDVIVPYKMALEEWYVTHQSLGLDLKLILLTILVVARPATRVDRIFVDLPTGPYELISQREGAA